MKIKLIFCLLCVIPFLQRFTFGTREMINQSNFENSVFAVIKISYNYIGDQHLQGGIYGTAFLINDSTAITACHILNEKNFVPNPGFKYAQYWLVNRGTKKILEIKRDDFKSFPDVETTVIRLSDKLKCDFKIDEKMPNQNDNVITYGHLGSFFPKIKGRWKNKLILEEFNLENSHSDKNGQIVSVKKLSIKSNDLNVKDKVFIKLSFSGNIGMSGGPLISKNKIIGLMSFGLPADSFVKKEVYAISIREIITSIKLK